MCHIIHLEFLFLIEEFSFICGIATTITSFLWKTLHFKNHYSLTREERRGDGGKGIHSLFHLHTFSTGGEKSSLMIPKGKDPFLKSFSGTLFKYNFPLNAKDKRLVSCMGLNMAFLSQYFWTHFFFLHYLIIVFPLSFPMMCENEAF